MDVTKLIDAGLDEGEADLLCKFAGLTRLAASDPAITSGTTYDLNYCNVCSDGFNKDKHFAFLRDYEEHTLLVVANFSGTDAGMRLTIPEHAFEWMEIAISDTLYPGMPIDVHVPSRSYTIITLI